MKFKKERVYNYPLKDICDLFLENEDGEAYDLSELENVTQWKVIKEDDLGDKRVGTKEWCAHAQIPKALQHVVSPKMLSWYEHSEWNRKDTTYYFRIEPFYLKKKIKCRGRTVYAAKGKNKCIRIFEIQLQVNIPIFGRMFEKLVMEHLKKNEEQDFGLTVKIADEHLGKKKK